MSDCIFCKIKDKEIPSVPIYEDDKIYVFRDADPQAPEHVLMIPKQHITGLDAVTAEDEWSYEFSDLPTMRYGEKITYSIKVPETDEEMLLAIWDNGYAESGSADEILSHTERTEE